MFLDHPSITATNAQTEPDRLERLQRVYGYAMALADSAGNAGFVDKLTQLHDHKGTLIVFWHAPRVPRSRIISAAPGPARWATAPPWSNTSTDSRTDT